MKRISIGKFNGEDCSIVVNANVAIIGNGMDLFKKIFNSDLGAEVYLNKEIDVYADRDAINRIASINDEIRTSDTLENLMNRESIVPFIYFLHDYFDEISDASSYDLLSEFVRREESHPHSLVVLMDEEDDSISQHCAIKIYVDESGTTLEVRKAQFKLD